MAQRKEPCAVCGVEECAMVFTHDPWCSDDHRKVYQRRQQGED